MRADSSRSLQGLALVAALVFVGSGCAPKAFYDPRMGAITRTDEAFVLPIAARDRARWQIEIPGVGGAEKRYPFDYDAIVYRIRSGGGPLVRPESVVVLAAHAWPDDVTAAPSIVERNEHVADSVRRWLGERGFGDLSRDEDRFVFDGQMLAIAEKEASEPLDAPTVGAAFLFGAEFALQAVYELYPPADGETMSAKEHQDALKAIAELLGRAQVK